MKWKALRKIVKILKNNNIDYRINEIIPCGICGRKINPDYRITIVKGDIK